MTFLDYPTFRLYHLCIQGTTEMLKICLRLRCFTLPRCTISQEIKRKYVRTGELDLLTVQAAQYCYSTLKRQLDTKKYNPEARLLFYVF